MAEDIKFRHTMPVQIRFSDVDQFGHMNNSVYFSLYDLAKTTYIKDVLGSADWSKLAIVVANINANFFMRYDLATKEPKLISEDYKEAICRYEEKTLEELSKG